MLDQPMQQSNFHHNILNSKESLLLLLFIFSGLAALALVNTNAAAAAGLVTWVVMDAIRGRISISGACVGPIVGLVAITPAAGFVQPGWSLLFGIIPTIVIYFVIIFKHHYRFDDTLDVAIVHGIGKIFKIEIFFFSK
jgi:Amt family ammonium transporter